MPIINGKVVRARYTSLKLNEISAVDHPAQPGARMLIMKRNDSQERADPMTKTVEQLEADLAKANSDLAEANKAIATLKAAKPCNDGDAEDMLDGGKDEASEMKKRLAEVTKQRDDAVAALAKATDEVITVGGQELRKSVVGEGNFSVAKALRDERDMAQFEKRAESEFKHVVGTSAEKAAILKAASAMPEEAKKSIEGIMAACESMTKAGFERIGSAYGQPNDTSKAAETGFMAKVAEVAKRDNISESDAMSKARVEFPDEFKAYAN